MKKKQSNTIAVNRKARHNYIIEDDYEAGMVLLGSEVKSIRNGNVSLKDSYADVNNNGEMFVYQMHISPYPFAYYGNHTPLRSRKLLLHKKEINRIVGKIKEKGITVIPLSLYFKKGKIKIKIVLAKGKKLYDKRQTIKDRDSKRELDRMKKEKNYM